MLQTIKTTLRLPGDLHRQLEKRAKATKQSVNRVIVDAIRRGLAQPLAEESERDRTIRVLRESGLCEPLGPEWDEHIAAAPDLTPAHLPEPLTGAPPLSAI